MHENETLGWGCNKNYCVIKTKWVSSPRKARELCDTADFGLNLPEGHASLPWKPSRAWPQMKDLSMEGRKIQSYLTPSNMQLFMRRNCLVMHHCLLMLILIVEKVIHLYWLHQIKFFCPKRFQQYCWCNSLWHDLWFQRNIFVWISYF